MFNLINSTFGINAYFNTLPEAIDYILYFCPTGNHYFIYLNDVQFCKIDNYTDFQFDMILYLEVGQNFVPYFKLQNKSY